MKVLLDAGVPRLLRKHLAPHQAVRSQERGWAELKNGELLNVAQAEFDALITNDSNIKFQQVIAKYSIGLLVLRAFDNKLASYLPMLPEIMTTLDTIRPGEAIYLYADEKLRESDQRKGKL